MHVEEDRGGLVGRSRRHWRRGRKELRGASGVGHEQMCWGDEKDGHLQPCSYNRAIVNKSLPFQEAFTSMPI